MATAKETRERAATRRMQALALREQGLPFREIGVRMGVSTSRAQQLYQTGLRYCTPRCRTPSYGVLDSAEREALLPLLPLLRQIADG